MHHKFLFSFEPARAAANQGRLKILEQGTRGWNDWRKANPDVTPDISDLVLSSVSLDGADLKEVDAYNTDFSQASLNRAEFFGAGLSGARFPRASLAYSNFAYATLHGADFRGAHLSRADFTGANLGGVDFSEADLSYANLGYTDLTFTNFTRANLKEVDLTGAHLIETILANATLTDCYVYGVSAWRLNTDGASQSNLIVSRRDEPIITVDNLEVAQFIDLLISNKKLRDVIQTITSKVVLVLGRFTPERKAVLNAIREEIRKYGYSPVLFDFERPGNRDFTETVSILAHMARFIIADITSPRSIPQELQAIVPTLAVPVIPILEISEATEYGMFSDFRKYHWVLKTHRYQDIDDLLGSFADNVIAPVEAKAKELDEQKRNPTN